MRFTMLVLLSAPVLLGCSAAGHRPPLAAAGFGTPLAALAPLNLGQVSTKPATPPPRSPQPLGPAKPAQPNPKAEEGTADLQKTKTEKEEFKPEVVGEVWKLLIEEKQVPEALLKAIEEAMKKIPAAEEEIRKRVAGKSDEELEKLSDEVRLEIVSQLAIIRDSLAKVRNGAVVQSATSVARLRGLLERLRDGMTPEKIRATAEKIERINTKAKIHEATLTAFIAEVDSRIAIVGKDIPQLFLDLIVEKHLDAQAAMDQFIEQLKVVLRGLDNVLGIFKKGILHNHP